VHAAYALESSLHSKVEADSLELNANEALVTEVVPVGPDEIVVSGAVVSGGGVVSTVNERAAGEASVLPATSVARTDTLCAPSLRALVVHGLAQLAHDPESTRHSNTELASLAANANVGVLSVVVPVGPDVIVVSGAVVSGGGAALTVKERVAGDASVLPATSVARTETECDPSLSADVVHGLAQSAHEPESTRHSKTELDSLAVKANVGVLSVVVPVGPDVIVVSGAVVSGGGLVVPEARMPRSAPSLPLALPGEPEARA
jgi:hypothetical protein